MEGKKISAKDLIDGARLANEALGWIDRVTQLLKDFRPERKRFRINYSNKSAEIKLAITNIDGISKKWRKINIPAYDGFTIREIQTATMDFIEPERFFDGKSWKINPSDINTDALLITMIGSIDDRALNSLVRVQPSINRDRTDKLEKYWLNAMIQDIELWENVWNILEIQDVNAGVEIALSSILKSIFPKEIHALLAATAQYLEAGESSDRKTVFNAWQKRRVAMKNAKMTPKHVIDTISKVSESDFMRDFLVVDHPYHLGNINPHQDLLNFMPKYMFVDTFTNLSLKSPTSTGYLTFKKAEFGENVIDQLENSDK